jgi:hypothetical protein
MYPELSRMQSACAILSSVTCPAVPHFSTLYHKGHDLNSKCIYFDFLCNSCLKHLILRGIQRDIINMHRRSCNIQYGCQNFMKPRIFSTGLENSSNIKFHENPSSGIRVVQCRRRGGQI